MPSRPTRLPAYDGIIGKYRSRLPLGEAVRAISLSEGNTPLIRLCNIEAELSGRVALYAKYEGLNPTGSFKDRGMTMAVTHAVAAGARAIICASTGNTSAAAAAYAARAGIKAFVLIPDGKIAAGKLAQAMVHGSVILQIKGNFDDGMRLVRSMADEAEIEIVNSINPYRLHGQKTAAFEVIEALGGAPDYHCLPVGNAGNISAYWLGYCESAPASDNNLPGALGAQLGLEPYACEQISEHRPVMVGYQAAGAAPFISGSPVDDPETVATAIRIGNPQSWDYAHSAREESGGWFDACSDEEILAAQRLLAEREGIYCEPASAASVAGMMRDVRSGKIRADSTVVCTLTGHGLKDPEIAMQLSSAPAVPVPVEPVLDAVRSVILGHLG